MFILWGNSNVYQRPTTYVIENKETYFEIYTYQESCPLARLFKTSQSAYQD